MQQTEFISGVVEGFYGQPWSHSQRLHLFEEMARLGLNTYFYTPKDDLKQRAVWRRTYDDSEITLFKELASKCDDCKLNFVYGLSPGLDLRFSDESELSRITNRFDQLHGIGVRHFALLFDDISDIMHAEDRGKYPSLASAQCALTNAAHKWSRAAGVQSRFFFCPTAYCDRMDREQLGGRGYLDEVGERLHPEIDLLWTGPEIVSSEIPLDSIAKLSQRIRRRPVIWDNLFANDYDLHRLHCGPYSGRDRELVSHVTGILINPNNEYLINRIPLHTFARFLCSEGPWDPRASFRVAAGEWLADFETVATPLTADDLMLLAECFYLPYEEGPQAQELLELIGRIVTQRGENWTDNYEQFRGLNRRIQLAFERLTEVRDRQLFYAWSRYAWQLKEELQRIDSYLRASKTGPTELTSTRDTSEWRAGGILAKLERLMPLP